MRGVDGHKCITESHLEVYTQWKTKKNKNNSYFFHIWFNFFFFLSFLFFHKLLYFLKEGEWKIKNFESIIKAAQTIQTKIKK